MSDAVERLRQALQDNYAVDRQVGEGGMATVFLAEDLKHRRRVAIKIMRPELAASIGPDRFLREIEMAAQLQHPHVVPVYDSGRIAVDGTSFLYYVMPFVEGESLRARMQRDGALPVGEAVRITCDAASALGYAHQQGIVHRDIKPENILLSGGHAVVADFGIARALNAASGGNTALTGLGMAIGTPAYMSPEQATAESVDARSDQYSLASVAYEMLAGRPAFTGTTVQSVITANITGPRPRIRSVRKGVPEAVERVIIKALDTDPAKRYGTVSEFAEALDAASRTASGGGFAASRWIAAAVVLLLVVAAGAWWFLGRESASPVVAEATRIAVMPFRASGPGAELLGEGMVDLLSTNLNGVGGVQTVEPRTVLQRLERRGTTTPSLEEALVVAGDVDARAVLLGSVVATGPRVRVSAELYARDGSRLAQAQADGPADSVLALVDGLSIDLMRAIWRSQAPIPAMHVGAVTTTSVDAMREYLQGERHYRRSQWDSAAAHFSNAVEADSTFALAHYRLASTHGWLGDQNNAGSRRASEMAVRFADRLPVREQTLVRAYQLFQRGDVAAIDTMRRYTQSYPQDPDGWYLLGEAQFHARQVFGFDPATLNQPFDQVLRLDSTLTPAAIHPLELALMLRDSAALARYSAALRAAGAVQESDHFRLARLAVWGPGDRDSALAQLVSQASFGRVAAALVGIVRAPTATSDTVLGTLEQAMATEGTSARQALGTVRISTMVGLGRLDAARPLVDSMVRAGSQDGALLANFTPIWLGYPTPGWGEEYLGRFRENASRDNPFVLFVLAMTDLSQGNLAAAEAPIAQALALDSTRMGPQMRGIFQAVRGWRTFAGGDSVAGLRLMGEGLRQAGGQAQGRFFAPLRFAYASALAGRPDTREAGIRWLRYGFDQEFDMLPIVSWQLAKTYEAGGERQAALEAYGRFVRLWDKADPALQPRVQEARQAMRDLAGEEG